jgi:fused signal recognition particle receptor
MAFSFARLTEGLRKTQTNWVARVREAIGTKQKLDGATLASVEEALLAGDVGIEVAEGLVADLKSDFAQIDGSEQALEHLKQALVRRLQTDGTAAVEPPRIALLVGVNGTGKTTTAGKLAHRYKARGERVLLAGCDTFRAAATDQLKIWADRVGVDVILGRPEGDPAAVAHDAASAAVARRIDRLYVDTAGRLHTKTNLMSELQKIARVIGNVHAGAPHEVLLVLDATTGQNGLRQAEEFHRAVALTGVVLTKMDGTARGGIIFAIGDRLGVPVRYIGLGEQAGDLDSFAPDVFVDALFAQHAGTVN